MSTVSTGRLAAIAALAFCAAIASTSAHAASHFDIGVGLGIAHPVYPTTSCDGHYETRVENILVSPEHRERRWADAAYETRYINGVPQSVCVAEAGWRELYVPARYETRYVQVWVPGCVTYYAPRYAPSYSSSFLDFSYRSRH